VRRRRSYYCTNHIDVATAMVGAFDQQCSDIARNGPGKIAQAGADELWRAGSASAQA
jgi:hypothetical protein